MSRWPLRLRLLLGFVLMALLPLTGLAWLYLGSFERALTQTVLQNIASIADKKTGQIDDFINERLGDAKVLVRAEVFRQALLELGRDFRRGGLPATDAAERRYRPGMQQGAKLGHYYDLLLIDVDGNVVFSLLREADLGSNLASGPYRDSGLARGWRQAMQSLQTDLTEFSPYAPSANKAAAFVVAPVFDGGRPIGALALQLNAEVLADVVNDNAGLGRTGETVVARRSGEDVLFTMPLRRLPDAAFRFRLPLAEAPSSMQRALAGGHGQGITEDYAGESVAAAWRYLPSLRWGMVVRVDLEEAFAPVYAAQRFIVWTLAVFLLLSVAAALWLGRRLIRTENIIALHEARFRGMFDSMHDGVCLYQAVDDGKDFVFLDFNAGAERITGLGRDQVVGRRVSEAFPGMEAAGILPAFRRVWQSGQVETLDFAEYQDSRLSLWVENHISRLPDGEVLAVFRDIRERKQAEAAVNFSREQLNDAQRLAKVGSWSLDLRSNRLEWSDEIFRIFEIDPEKFGASYDAFLNAIHPEDRAVVDQANIASLGNRTPYVIAHRLLLPDGRVKHVEERCETLYAEDGAPVLSRGTVQDITATTLANDALRLYASVFQNSGEAILISDGDNRIVAINPAFTALTGYTLDEVRGQDPKLLASGQTPPEIYKAMWAALLGTGFWQGELWDRRKDGHIYPKWISASVVRNPAGVITNLIASFSDITERKAAFERIRQINDELELRVLDRTRDLEGAKKLADKANQAKSEFLARMSHELRTPLNAVLGFSQLMQSDRREPPSKNQLECLEQIHRAGRHLLDLINEILDLAKVESGHFELDLQAVELGPVISHCRKLIQPLATNQGVIIHQAPVETPCFVRADVMRLRQVLINLLSNAVKYNDACGTVRLSLAERAGFVDIAVADTGHGIPPDMQHMLFQPFQRLEANPNAIEGTGIGLALSKSLVELMGGSISVSSEPGVGSTFTVSLPRAEAGTVGGDEAVATESPALIDTAARKHRILYIEDEPVNLRLIETLLAREGGFEFFGAPGGTLGLELASAHRPDLILLDINMPGMDGMEVLRRLRLQQSTSDIPVVAVSANAMPQDIDAALAAGFDNYVTKPIDIQALLDIIDGHLRPG